LRCVAKYLHDRNRVPKDELRIETDAGLKKVYVERGSDSKAATLTVDMGPPRLRRGEVPFLDGGPIDEPAIGVPLELAGRLHRVTAVSMGNPHAVIRLDHVVALDGGRLPSLSELPLEQWGPRFEHHPWFPERTNTEFIVPRSRSEIDFRVWERGSGETLACGTGACAAVVAAVLNGWCDRDAVVHLRGGDLRIRWDGSDERGTVWMTGGATEVFTGELSE
jgi:diaminopimelate epimerase